MPVSFLLGPQHSGGLVPMKNILILDDNKDILSILETNLCHYLKDCKVLTAADGQKGIELLGSLPIDLVLTDLDMPKADSYRFIQHARERFPSVRVCVMTDCECDKETVDRLRSMGVSRTIEKPFPYGALAAMIDEELSAGPPGPVGCKDKAC
jgi:DNA-binding response OmpR family regulator